MGRRVLEAVVGAVVLASLVHQFVAMGIATPLVVSGSSMAPALHGDGTGVECPGCGATFWVGDDQGPAPQRHCPYCREARLRPTRRTPPDRLLVDRTGRAPERFDAVVLRPPFDAGLLSIKRVLGLPGERVRFVAGELAIDGRMVQKPLGAQLRVRLPVLGPDGAPASFSVEPAPSDSPLPASAGPSATLVWSAPGVWDLVPGNLRVSRRLQRVGDLMVDLTVDLGPRDRVRVELTSGGRRATARLEPGPGGSRLSVESPGPPAVARGAGPRAGRRRLILSTFDGRALLAVDGVEVLSLACPTPPGQREGAEARVTVEGAGARTGAPRLWRDVVYESGAAVGGSATEWRVGPGELFVVGDNQAVSRDSRNWGPAAGVPARLLVGVARGR